MVRRLRVGGIFQDGVPLPLALFVVLAEFVGSLALISGIFARITSAAILLLMAGAIATVHAQLGFFYELVRSAKR